MPQQDDAFRQWLTALGLEAHAEAFARHDVDLRSLRHLSDADLQSIGLTLGQRRRLQSALQSATAASAAEAVSRRPATGERRQMTVMFCDLVGSTALSTRLDPEDLRGLIHAYYSTCCRIIEDAGGFIAQLVGDGVLAYFGYPAAREDAAECAIRAGLRIVDATHRVPAEGPEALDVRVGIATGLSVAGGLIGDGFEERHAAVGQTPNLASRIQALAAPGSVVVSDETRRLAAGYFLYADHGQHPVKGLARPVQLWRVIAQSDCAGRYDARHPAPTACIGREAQRAAVRQAWEDAGRVGCRIVTVVGEAGIGKSCLLSAARQELEDAAGLSVLLQCAPSQSGTPWFPVVEWLRHETGIDATPEAGRAAQLQRWLGDDASALDLTLLAEFLGLPPLPGVAPPALPPDRKRALLRELVIRHFERRSEGTRALLMVEDAHWIDGASAAFLTALFERLRERAVLGLVTTRPDEARRWRDAATTTLTLDPLPQHDARALIHRASGGRAMPPAVVDDILAKTDGVPLFIEELTATVLESGQLRAEHDAWVLTGPLPAVDVPSTLRDSLMARLDRLGEIREVARVGSAIGREFPFELLAQVSGEPHDTLRRALDRLVQAQLLFPRGTPPQDVYVFKHALVQQAAYDSQLRSERQALHARIVAAIETHQPELARREPGLMVHHCQLAGLTERELDYLVAAGAASTRLVAIPEALSYYGRADAAIGSLPPTPARAMRQIEIILGTMEVGRFAILPSRLRALSARARALASQPGVACDAATTAAILFQDGRANVYSSRYAEARGIFEEIRALGRAGADPRIERKPASAYSMCLCCQGLFEDTLDYLNADNIGWYKASGSFIDYISGLGWIAYASCQTGDVEAGLRWGDLSVQEARAVQSPIYLAGAYVWRSHAYMAARRWPEAIADAQACVDLAEAHAVPYLGWHGLVFLALCLSRHGDAERASRTLARARAMLAQVEDRCWSLLDYLPAIEAEIAWLRGDDLGALDRADEALAVAQPIDGHYAAAIARRVQACAGLRSGQPLADCQARLDDALRLQALGGAQAERTYTAALWAQVLAEAGHAAASNLWAAEAETLAARHGFRLEDGEYLPRRGA